MKSIALILAVLLAAWQGEAFVARASTRAPAAPRHQPRGRSMIMADVEVEFTKSGKKVKAVVGTPLSQLCAKNGVKVKYSCKQGDCATCSINIDGRNVKACQGKVPSSRRVIKIKA